MPTWAIIAVCVGCFVLGAAALYAFLWYCVVQDNKKRKKRPTPRSESPKVATDDTNQTKPKAKSKLGTMDLILIIIGVVLLVFVIYMIKLFREYDDSRYPRDVRVRLMRRRVRNHGLDQDHKRKKAGEKMGAR